MQTVRESDVILVNRVPFLDSDLFPLGSTLSSNQLLQVSDGVVRIALHSNFPTKAVWGDKIGANEAE